MDGEEVRQRMLDVHGIRVEPEMSEYVARRLAGPPSRDGGFHVIGGDARTGVPVRKLVDPGGFRSSSSSSPQQ